MTGDEVKKKGGKLHKGLPPWSAARARENKLMLADDESTQGQQSTMHLYLKDSDGAGVSGLSPAWPTGRWSSLAHMPAAEVEDVKDEFRSLYKQGETQAAIEKYKEVRRLEAESRTWSATKQRERANSERPWWEGGRREYKPPPFKKTTQEEDKVALRGDPYHRGAYQGPDVWHKEFDMGHPDHGTAWKQGVKQQLALCKAKSLGDADGDFVLSNDELRDYMSTL